MRIKDENKITYFRNRAIYKIGVTILFYVWSIIIIIYHSLWTAVSNIATVGQKINLITLCRVGNNVNFIVEGHAGIILLSIYIIADKGITII